VEEDEGGASRRLKETKSISPWQFKRTLGQWKRRFIGREQQDAHEVLVLLLEALSDDLNRAKEKAYIENADSAGRPDAVVASEWWRTHIRREESVVSALFSAQVRILALSLLSSAPPHPLVMQVRQKTLCTESSFESTRFEPQNAWGLVLPDAPDYYYDVRLHLVPQEGSGGVGGGAAPLMITVAVAANSLLEDLILAIVQAAANIPRDYDGSGGSSSSSSRSNGRKEGSEQYIALNVESIEVGYTQSLDDEESDSEDDEGVGAGKGGGGGVVDEEERARLAPRSCIRGGRFVHRLFADWGISLKGVTQQRVLDCFEVVDCEEIVQHGCGVGIGAFPQSLLPELQRWAAAPPPYDAGSGAADSSTVVVKVVVRTWGAGRLFHHDTGAASLATADSFLANNMSTKGRSKGAGACPPVDTCRLVGTVQYTLYPPY
jgi:hypothetical protein